MPIISRKIHTFPKNETYLKGEDNSFTENTQRFNLFWEETLSGGRRVKL